MRDRLSMLVSLLALLISAQAVQAAEPPTVAKHVAIFDKPPQHVPTRGMVDGPLLGNGDVGVVLAGPPEAQQFHLGKNDFWCRHDASVMAVGSIRLDVPALAGAAYHQEQDLAHGEVRGTFSKDLLTVRTRSWVSAEENLLVTSLRCEGSTPVMFVLRQMAGPDAGQGARLADNGRPFNVGREQYGNARWYFDGWIEDVRIEPRAFSAEEIGRLVTGAADRTGPQAFRRPEHV